MSEFLKKTRASVKFFLFTLLCLLVVPTQSLILLFTRGKAAYILPWLWQAGVCAIFGIKVSVKGTPHKDRQMIFVSNHLSYLDIPSIGSFLRASFVAKQDVSGWPVFGFLSTLQQTAFISRSKSSAQAAKNTLDNMLAEGKSLIIFPEGTSTDGTEVVPFKSSLFALFMQDNHKDIEIQPFSVKMKTVDGKAIETQEDRDLYSWHRHMHNELHEHLWDFAKGGGAEIEIEFYAPHRPADFENRKTLAKACQEVVCKGLGLPYKITDDNKPQNVAA